LVIGYCIGYFAICDWLEIEVSSTGSIRPSTPSEGVRADFLACLVRTAWTVTAQELRDRTKKYAIDTARFVEPLFGHVSRRDAASQLSRAAASVAANYRAACVARSHAEFIAKIGLALEECDESVYWLEFLAGCGCFGEELGRLTIEGRELTKILGASKRTSRARSRTPRPRRRK